jgi:hypothetical protein
MALEISGNVELQGGITLSSIYGRTFYSVFVNSGEVKIGVQYWTSKDAYDNNLGYVEPNLSLQGYYPYDRLVDGDDVLLFTQNKIKEQLEAQGFSVVITEL